MGWPIEGILGDCAGGEDSGVSGIRASGNFLLDFARGQPCLRHRLFSAVHPAL